MKASLIFVLIAALTFPVHAETKNEISAPIADNPQIKALFDDDQKVRQTGYKGPWNDEARRVKARALLAKDALKTATDFREAAFIFQHGDSADNFLLAHTLAMIAVAKGDSKSLWIASATLDRYLLRIGQKQIYGTQYQILDKNGKLGLHGKWSQEPYNRTLISDALRQDLGVPSQARQEAVLETHRKDFEDFQDRLKNQAGK